MSEQKRGDSSRVWMSTLGRAAANPAVAVGVLAIGVAASFLAMRKQGYDAQFPYLYARGILNGYPIFDKGWRDQTVTSLTGLLPPQEGMFYPPGTGIVLLPFGLFPFETARILMVLALNAAIVVGTYLVFALARPQVGWATRTTVAGCLLLTACARWSFTPVQIAPIFALLVVACAYGLHRSATWLAFLATLVAFALKITLGVPFVLLLVLHRRFKLLAAALAGAFVLNLIGFARFGGRDAIDAYRDGTANLEVRGTINTPDFWELASVPRTDWTYLFTGLSGSEGLARSLSVALACVVAVYLLAACWQAGQRPSLADSARMMLAGTALTLLAVYHHHYDMAALLTPLLLVALLHRELGLTWRSWTTWAMVPVTVVMVLVPSDRAGDVMQSIVGDRGPGLVNVVFPLATFLALAGAIGMIEQARRARSSPPGRTPTSAVRGEGASSVVDRSVVSEPIPPHTS